MRYWHRVLGIIKFLSLFQQHVYGFLVFPSFGTPNTFYAVQRILPRALEMVFQQATKNEYGCVINTKDSKLGAVATYLLELNLLAVRYFVPRNRNRNLEVSKSKV